jgi:hypothetical protein
MNIFVLHTNPTICAKWHVDRHIVKMPLESAQMLCTALNINGVKSPYKSAHINHPCSIWVRQSFDNYMWLCTLAKELCKEYTFRYGKIHACQSVIDYAIENVPDIPKIGLTPFALAMDDVYKLENPILSYQNYYIKGKAHLHSWKKRKKPSFIN